MDIELFKEGTLAALLSPTPAPPEARTARTSTVSYVHEQVDQGARGESAAINDTPSISATQVISAQQRRACAYVFLANLPHLIEAYGQDFGAAVSSEIQRRLSVHFVTSDTTDTARLRDDCFLLWANDAFACGTRPILEWPHDLHASSLVETLLAVLGTEPVRAKGIVALVQLHVDWIEVRSPEQLGASEIEFTLWTAQPFPDPADSGGHHTEGRHQRYRADMNVAVQVSEALRMNELSFAWHPVVHAGSKVSTLYYEGRISIAPSSDATTPLAPEVFMPCLQRLGLIRAFDRVVMRQALVALRLYASTNIGVSISAQSTRLDHWWASILAALDEEPSLASRLVIEITGSPGLPDLEATHDFCVQMQLRGCRIALRNFGSGSDNLAAVHSCGPDIIKLNASFLRRARDSVFSRDCLRGMVSMCTHFASHVVVDGVEREDDVHIATQVGALWLQGYKARGNERRSRASDRPTACSVIRL